jgi:hypothetical protein
VQGSPELGPVDLDAAESGTIPGGSALRVGQQSFVLLDDAPAVGLGRALTWSQHQATPEVHVLASASADVLARRASQFARPPHIWQVNDRSVVAATPARPSAAVDPPAEALDLVDLLAAAGTEIVIEHGVVIGEIAGLEVARIVVDDDGARVEVGVGRHDREAFALVHGEMPTAEALASVVDYVRRHRRVGGPSHPLSRLAPERWLRASIVADPARLGLRQLEPVEPTLARSSVKDVVCAAAVGLDEAGDRVVVACSVGIDLDLVPAAADVRAGHAPDARLVLAVPARDAHPVTRRLAAALTQPAEVVELTTDWRS